MRSRTVLIGVALALSVCAAPGVRSGEPAGYAETGYAWSTPDGGPPSLDGELTITIRPAVPLRGAEIALAAPRGVTIVAKGHASGGEDRPLAIGDLAAGATRVLTFEVRVMPGAGGIAEFRLAGTLVDGKQVTEPIGVPVGITSPGPRHRHGAAEYPAKLATPRGP